MAVTRQIDSLRIEWSDPTESGTLEPMVNIMGTITDDAEETRANVSWTFLRSDLSPSATAKLDAFLADVLGHVRGKLGAGRPVSLPS